MTSLQPIDTDCIQDFIDTSRRKHRALMDLAETARASGNYEEMNRLLAKATPYRVINESQLFRDFRKVLSDAVTTHTSMKKVAAAYPESMELHANVEGLEIIIEDMRQVLP